MTGAEGRIGGPRRGAGGRRENAHGHKPGGIDGRAAATAGPGRRGSSAPPSRVGLRRRCVQGGRSERQIRHDQPRSSGRAAGPGASGRLAVLGRSAANWGPGPERGLSITAVPRRWACAWPGFDATRDGARAGAERPLPRCGPPLARRCRPVPPAQRSHPSMNGSRAPSSTAWALPTSTPVRWSLTMVYGLGARRKADLRSPTRRGIDFALELGEVLGVGRPAAAPAAGSGATRPGGRRGSAAGSARFLAGDHDPPWGMLGQPHRRRGLVDVAWPPGARWSGRTSVRTSSGLTSTLLTSSSISGDNLDQGERGVAAMRGVERG